MLNKKWEDCPLNRRSSKNQGMRYKNGKNLPQIWDPIESKRCTTKMGKNFPSWSYKYKRLNERFILFLFLLKTNFIFTTKNILSKLKISSQQTSSQQISSQHGAKPTTIRACFEFVWRPPRTKLRISGRIAAGSEYLLFVSITVSYK